MLRITIELCKYGITSNPKILHRGYITNTGTGTSDSGDYFVDLYDGDIKKQTDTGRITDFPRTKKSAWWLLYCCLKEIFEKDV